MVTNPSNLARIKILHSQFSERDWFHSVGQDKSGRLVVYVKYMCDETTHDIPRQVDNVNVLVHFATSKDINPELFAHKGFKSKKVAVLDTVAERLATLKLAGDDSDDDSILEPDASLDLRELISELDRLEKVCGSNIMQDIFYEVHDGANAVTNLSSKFPDVRHCMDNLYQQFGFDLIYENMDG